MKVLLTHTPQMRRDYYGERSLNGLRAVAEVTLHEGADALDAAALVDAARDVEIIVADRMTPGPGEIFAKLPKLRAQRALPFASNFTRNTSPTPFETRRLPARSIVPSNSPTTNTLPSLSVATSLA